MGLQLSKIQDPRDTLQKIRRKDLERLLRKHAPNKFEPGMPADLMRKILRANGIRNVDAEQRPLGAMPDMYKKRPSVRASDEPASSEVDAMDDLEAQWRAQKQQPAQQQPTDPAQLTMPALRKYAKEQGLKIQPSMKKADILARLGQSNGEDATSVG